MKTGEKDLSEKLFEKYNYCLEKKDCQDLAEDILNIVSESNLFSVPLREWLNGKRLFSDVTVNDFSLVDLASKLDERNPNIPVAILILGLEAQDDMTYHGLAAVADYKCLANPKIILGQKCEYAIFSNDEWFFMLSDQNIDELKEYQAWQILLLNPTLILQVAYEHPNNTSLALQEDGSYLIDRNEEV